MLSISSKTSATLSLVFSYKPPQSIVGNVLLHGLIFSEDGSSVKGHANIIPRPRQVCRSLAAFVSNFTAPGVAASSPHPGPCSGKHHVGPGKPQHNAQCHVGKRSRELRGWDIFGTAALLPISCRGHKLVWHGAIFATETPLKHCFRPTLCRWDRACFDKALSFPLCFSEILRYLLSNLQLSSCAALLPGTVGPTACSFQGSGWHSIGRVHNARCVACQKQSLSHNKWPWQAEWQSEAKTC